MNLKNNLLLSLVCLGLVSCMSDAQLEKKMSEIIKKNPQMIIDSIKENQADYIIAIQDAAKGAQDQLAKKRAEEEEKKLLAMYDSPLEPKIRGDESIRGNKNAPLTLVEYSDFECPFCARGYNTVMELLKKYGTNIRFVYKHLPLSFHKQAMAASKYYEALRLQSPELAFKFHDEIYKNQSKLKTGEKFLKAEAKKLGANMAKLEKDVKSEAIEKRIEEDLQEAASFGMQGTPGFVLNGIPVKGAYPTSHFIGIVDELKKRGKVKL